jgi:hypothetical protein
MRRGTVIALIVLTFLLAGAATWQLILASQDRDPYPIPRSEQPSLGP